jgi:TldD protein
MHLPSRSFFAFVFAPVLAAAIAVPAVAQGAPTRADAEKDSVLRAMLAELDRSQQHLQLPGFDKPYFIEYRIDDVTAYHAEAAYGALTGEDQTHSRIGRVTVRVGDYKSDNSGPRGEGSVQIVAAEDDPLAIRYALWAATDTAYKQALDAWAAKQAELKSVQTPPQADDFSHQKPFLSLEPIIALDLDREAWKHNIVEGSGLYSTDPSAKSFADEIENSQGSIEARVRTVYLVNTEGAIVRTSSSEYRAEVALETQAPDGMRLERSYPVTGVTAADLGSADQFHHGVLEILDGLHQLHDTPVVTDEYHGPVLFSGSAAARSFDEYFARALTASRPQLGSTARTTGPFASSYNTRVLPDFMKIVDDPSLTEFNGKALLGAYKVDDQGVPAQDVTLVDDGKLTGYLLGREPIRDFPESNGHGRAPIAQPARSSIGVLHVEATGGLSEDDLVKKLISMGKDQGLDSVYLLQTKSSPTEPRTLYRIRVADGSRELVRGARLADIDLRSFRSDIVAVGSDPHVDNIFGDVPATIIAPALLFDDVTVKHSEDRNQKLPYYPPPQ